MARPRGRGLEKQRIVQAHQREAVKTARSRRRGLVTGLVALAAVGGIAAFIWLQPPPPGEVYPSLGNFHLSAAEEPHAPYNSSPPSSGPHIGSIQPWGESTVPVAPELFVHNLEDRGVALTYDCPDGCDDLVEGLRKALEDFEGRNVLLTPYAGIVDKAGTPHRAAAVAWGRVYYFDEATEQTRDALYEFISLYEGIDHHVG